VAFSPDGRMLAVANLADGTLSAFSVNPSTAGLTPVAGSPFATAPDPHGLAFSPDGALLAVPTGFTNPHEISVYSVNSAAGSVNEVAGSPFPFADVAASGIAWAPVGTFLATANPFGPNVSVFSVTELAATTTNLTCPSTGQVGAATRCTATVSNSAGAGPGGAVTFSSATAGRFDPPEGACGLQSGAGSSQCSVLFVPAAAGADTLTAAYGGDQEDNQSRAAAALSVSPGVAAITATCSPGVVAVGARTTCRATVTDALSHGSGPTGTASFSSATGRFSSASCRLASGSCTVTYTPARSSPNTITINTRYAGDHNYAGATGATTVALPPTAGVTSDVRVVSGVVRIKFPKGAHGTGAPAPGATVAIPTGSQLDTTKGTVTLSTAADYLAANDRHHHTDQGTFADGLFTIKQMTERQARQQARRRHQKHLARPTAELIMKTPGGAVKRAGCKRKGKIGKGVVRTLSGVAKGVYRTVGAASTTTATNASWVIQDRCDGTLTTVRKGHATVTYRQNGHLRTRTLHAGQNLLAKERFLADRLASA
jgi:hypothetical protein